MTPTREWARASARERASDRPRVRNPCRSTDGRSTAAYRGCFPCCFAGSRVGGHSASEHSSSLVDGSAGPSIDVECKGQGTEGRCGGETRGRSRGGERRQSRNSPQVAVGREAGGGSRQRDPLGPPAHALMCEWAFVGSPCQCDCTPGAASCLVLFDNNLIVTVIWKMGRRIYRTLTGTLCLCLRCVAAYILRVATQILLLRTCEGYAVCKSM